jgi:hypothetical protein
MSTMLTGGARSDEHTQKDEVEGLGHRGSTFLNRLYLAHCDMVQSLVML